MEVRLSSLNWWITLWACCGNSLGKPVLGWPLQHFICQLAVPVVLLSAVCSITVRWSATLASSLIPCQCLPLIDRAGFLLLPPCLPTHYLPYLHTSMTLQQCYIVTCWQFSHNFLSVNSRGILWFILQVMELTEWWKTAEMKLTCKNL